MPGRRRISKKSEESRIVALLAHSSIIVRENAARIYAAYSLDGRKLSDGMLAAALRMIQDASDENVTVPRLEAALLH